MKAFEIRNADYKVNIAEGLDSILDSIANMAMNSGELAIGTSSKAKVKVVKDLFFQVDGVMKMIAAGTEIAFTATTDDITANATTAQERTYILASNGTTTKLVGGVQAASGASVDPTEAVLEAAVAGYVALGRVKIVIAAGETPFDASTDLLDAAHITDTYENLGLYAGRFSDIM